MDSKASAAHEKAKLKISQEKMLDLQKQGQEAGAKLRLAHLDLVAKNEEAGKFYDSKPTDRTQKQLED